MSTSGPMPPYIEPENSIKNGDILIAKEDYFATDPSKGYHPITGYPKVQLLTKGKRYTDIVVQKSRITAGNDVHFIHDHGKVNYWVMYSALEHFDVITLKELRKEKLNRIDECGR